LQAAVLPLLVEVQVQVQVWVVDKASRPLHHSQHWLTQVVEVLQVLLYTDLQHQHLVL
jgi:hypothetical protein